MATLGNEDRESLTQVFEDGEGSMREKIIPGRQDIQAAVNAIDEWVEANIGSFNAVIPEPARSGLTAKQKAKLLKLVVGKRWEVS